MKMIQAVKNSRHHAFSVSGDGSVARSEIFNALASGRHFNAEGNPDFFDQKFTAMGVDEARRIKDFQDGRAFGGQKVIIVEADLITVPAQNAMLKMFEEPADNTVFFVLGDCVKNLIPTLASRLFRIESESASAAGAAEARAFLQVPLARRLAIAKKLADEIKDEKRPKADAARFINGIEKLLYQNDATKNRPPHPALAALSLCASYARDQSGSVKMLLEYAALVAPEEKTV